MSINVKSLYFDNVRHDHNLAISLTFFQTFRKFCNCLWCCAMLNVYQVYRKSTNLTLFCDSQCGPVSICLSWSLLALTVYMYISQKSCQVLFIIISDWILWTFVDAASCAIVRFLEIESTEELSNGWMLLCTINLLSMGGDTLIDCMTVASLPSTLVKCLYLFFDLPDVHNADMLMPGCEFTPRESRILLQKVFVQVDLTFLSFKGQLKPNFNLIYILQLLYITLFYMEASSLL